MQTVPGFAVLDKVDMPVFATTGAVLEQNGNARCFDDRCIWFLRAENCGGSAVAGMVDVCWRSSSTVVDVPVIKQRQVGVATMLHMAVMAAMKYGGLDWRWRGFFGGIDAFFRAPLSVAILAQGSAVQQQCSSAAEYLSRARR